MEFTSRERLQRTLEHKDPGKVVVDLGSNAVTGINANALDRLRKKLGLQDQLIKVDEPLQLLGRVEEDVRQALGIDVVGVSSDTTLYGFFNEGWKPWKLQTGLDVLVPEMFNTTVDEKGTTYLYPQGNLNVPPAAEMPKDGHFFDNIIRGDIEYDEDDKPSAREDFCDDFGIFTDEQLRRIENNVNYYYNNTDYGIFGGGALAGFGDFASVPGPNVLKPKGVRDLVNFMVAHHTLPNYIHELFEFQLEVGLKNAELYYQAAGDKVQAMFISGTDFGIQTGPYMALDAYREFYKPYHKKINDWVHTHTKWKTFYHTCGSVVAFLQDFYEAGIDILNPVQCSAAGMDPTYLKQQWGDKFVFWGGGSDTQKTLPFGTPEQVYQETMSRLEIFAKGGGYVFNPIHNIQPAVSAENILAMFQAVRDYNAKN